jgi:predicted amidohydrolase
LPWRTGGGIVRDTEEAEPLPITIAVVQTKPVFLDVKANIREAIGFLAETRCDVAVLPELFTSGYTFARADEVRAVAIAPDDPVLGPLYDLSRGRRMGICGGYAERFHDAFFNSSFFIGDGKLVANYRKTHLFSHEKEFFSPGDTGFFVFSYKETQFGMMVCFDWFFPEAARTLALLGTDVILHPANLVLPYCQRAMFTRAVENRVFTVTANRVGTEENGERSNTFTGGSVAVSPAGSYLLEMDKRLPQFKTIEIDPAAARDKKVTALNDLFADRRPQFYI